MSEMVLAPDRVERSLARLDRLARLMDDQFEVPVLKVRVGLDPIIGLIPGGGDWVTWVVSSFILWEAAKLRVPKPLLLQMAANLTVDFLAGYVPVAGDVADIFIKANRKNVDLVFRYFQAETDPLARSKVVVKKDLKTLENTNPVLIYGLAIAIISVLFVIASIPIALLIWAFSEG